MFPRLNTAVRAVLDNAKVIERLRFKMADPKLNLAERQALMNDAIRTARFNMADMINLAHPKDDLVGTKHTTESKFTWIITPITNPALFQRNIHDYMLAIVIKFDRKVDHAVFYNPNTQDLYAGSNNHGATLNQVKLQVSKKEDVTECYASLGDLPAENLKSAIHNHFHSVINFSSPEFALLQLASGKIDLFCGKVSNNLGAAKLLVKEAGGIVTNFPDENGDLLGENIIAGNARLVNLVLKGAGKAAA